MFKEKQINSLIGQRLVLIREQRGLSRSKLASLLDISHQQLDKYEKGINRISAAKLVIICKKLEVSPLFFYSNLAMKEDISNEMQNDLNKLITYFIQIDKESKRIAVVNLVKELVF